MINALFTGLLTICHNLAGSIMVAPLNTITAFFPSLNDYISTFTTYINYCVSCVPLVLDLLLIPRAAVVFLFDYYIAKYSIFLVSRGIKLILNIYHKLAP